MEVEGPGARLKSASGASPNATATGTWAGASAGAGSGARAQTAKAPKPTWNRFLSRPEREQNAYFGFPKYFDLESLLDPTNFFVLDDTLLITASIDK